MSQKKPADIKPGQGRESLHFLDGLRGLAALYVLIGHAVWLLWAGYRPSVERVPHLGFDWHVYALFFSLFRFGHEAVFFFFVLSGFAIHLKYAKKLHESPQTATFGWRAYIWRRARRLYPPLLFAMALTFACDMAWSRLGYYEYYEASRFFKEEIFGSVMSWKDFFGNLAFLMSIYVPAWGTDSPLWSLAYEWWFYMLYPLFWFLSKRSIVVPVVILGALFALVRFPDGPMAAAAPLIAQKVFTTMIIWWMGVLLADMYAGRIRRRFGLLSLLSFCFLLLPFRFFGVFSGHVAALGFVGLLSFCFYLQEKRVKLGLLEALKPLGDMSYTLYVTHFPVLILLAGWQMSMDPLHLQPVNFLWLRIGVVVCMLLAYAAHFVVEKPFTSRH